MKAKCEEQNCESGLAHFIMTLKIHKEKVSPITSLFLNEF